MANSNFTQSIRRVLQVAESLKQVTRNEGQYLSSSVSRDIGESVGPPSSCAFLYDITDNMFKNRITSLGLSLNHSKQLSDAITRNGIKLRRVHLDTCTKTCDQLRQLGPVPDSTIKSIYKAHEHIFKRTLDEWVEKASQLIKAYTNSPVTTRRKKCCNPFNRVSCYSAENYLCGLMASITGIHSCFKGLFCARTKSFPRRQRVFCCTIWDGLRTDRPLGIPSFEMYFSSCLIFWPVIQFQNQRSRYNGRKRTSPYQHRDKIRPGSIPTSATSDGSDTDIDESDCEVCLYVITRRPLTHKQCSVCIRRVHRRLPLLMTGVPWTSRAPPHMHTRHLIHLQNISQHARRGIFTSQSPSGHGQQLLHHC